MKNQKQLLLAVILILVAVFSRMLPHPSNFTAIGAAGLFGAAVIKNKRLAFLVPFVALFISDIFIGFYPFMWVTYLGFSLFAIVGLVIHNKTNALNILIGSIVGTILFFLVTNLPIFYTNLSLYPITWQGTLLSYEAALPFLKNQLIGELIYTAILFGVYELSKNMLVNKIVKV